MKSKDRQTWVWGIVALAVCAAALYWSLRPAPPPQSTLETAAVEIGDLTLEVPATGSVDAVNVIDLGAPVTGRIQALHVDFNDRVKAGQVLAEIEDSNYRATFLQAQANLEMARAGVETAASNLAQASSDHARASADAESSQATYRQAQSDFARTRQLLSNGIAMQSDFDKSEAANRGAAADVNSTKALADQAAAKVKSAEAALAQARAIVDQRTAVLAMAKRNLDYCRIVSPVDGVVVARNVDVGQTVAAQLQAPSLFNIAQDLTHMYVYTKLDASDIAKVHAGLPATFTVNAFPGETFEGKLVSVRVNANEIDPIQKATGLTGLFKRSLSAGTTAGSVSASESVGGAAVSASQATNLSSTTTTTFDPSGRITTVTSTPTITPTTTAATSTNSNPSGLSVGLIGSNVPPDTQRNTVVVYDALIEFQNPGERILPGMTAYVTIPVNSVKQMMKVPSFALRFAPKISEQEKQDLLRADNLNPGDPMVWVMEADKRLRPVRVKPVLTDFVFTAVESTDLKPGMQVVTRIIEQKSES
jgi:multidrug efflux pump subunit AcrA (membrane-fusion protein)